MVKKVGVGLIGTGNIALMHTLGYQNCPDAEIRAICDLDASKAKAFREETKISSSVKIYSKPADLFKDNEIDLVEILTPHASHEALAIQAAEGHKHISVQKPPAMTLSSYDRMVNAAKKAGVRFRVYENFRYHPPYVKAFELIKNNVIGTVESVNVRMYESVKCLGEYRGSKKRFPIKTMLWKIQEGQCYKTPTMFDDGYHKHSIIQAFLGGTPKKNERISAIRAWCGWQKLLGVYKIDSPSVVIYETKKANKYGTWNVTLVNDIPFHSNYFACDEFVEIVGSNGLITINGCTGDLYKGCNCGGPGAPGVYWFSKEKNEVNPPYPGAGTWKSDTSMGTDWSYSFIDCTQHLAHVLATDTWFDENDPRPVQAEEGRHLLAINLAIIRSLRLNCNQVPITDIHDGPGIEDNEKINESNKKFDNIPETLDEN